MLLTLIVPVWCDGSLEHAGARGTNSVDELRPFDDDA